VFNSDREIANESILVDVGNGRSFVEDIEGGDNEVWEESVDVLEEVRYCLFGVNVI
jgi:hypothetical protein